MISQKCPKCNSSRVRRGYRPTPFFLKLVCRFNLLCDTCNWEFKGFAVPGTLSSNPTRKKKKPTLTPRDLTGAVPRSEKEEDEPAAEPVAKSVGKTVNTLL